MTFSSFLQISLYLDDQPFTDSTVMQLHSKKSLDTFLLWHYDLTYSLLNSNKLLSTGSDQDIIDAPGLS